MPKLDIPHALIDNVRTSNTVLFLGAGASRGAFHPDRKDAPTSQQLAEQLADRFLGQEFRARPLAQVAELAISETDLVSVQRFVSEIFEPYAPADFHRLIPLFSWAAIATTNYDLLVERAYDAEASRAQRLVAFKKDGERIDERVRRGDVPLLKLHGCVTNIHDPACPLILTPDQYVSHRTGRKRLFERLADYAREYSFVFVGHSLEDPDLRAILLELEQLGASKPRNYLVVPHLMPADERYWEHKKFTCLKATFAEFMTALDASIPRSMRGLAARLPQPEHPVQRRLTLPVGAGLSDALLRLLDHDAEYVHAHLATQPVQPNQFYKGYFTDWGPIVANLDVRRRIGDDLISDIILADEAERVARQELVIVKGSAGSGKTVLLRRSAWEAAAGYDKLCLVVRPDSHIDYDALHELQRLSRQRVFLFVDAVAEHVETVERLLARAQADRLPLTIIAAERPADWNMFCESLGRFVTATYEVPYLSEREIEELLSLLKRHKSLGHLSNKTHAQQIEDLSKRSGRQLLVALHEATFGKPFEEIVCDEYAGLGATDARTLYLTVCVLHRLGVPTRAGLISRVHGIPFARFKEELFKPLESVVFARERPNADFAYETRHPHVAEIVFERILGSVQQRYDEYVRIVNALDVDYSTDREALLGMMKAHRLRALFPDITMCRELFRAANFRSPNDTSLMQQEAILEMNHGSGSLEVAAQLLEEAHRLRPRSLAILHSLAELAMRRADQAQTELEKGRYRARARELCNDLIRKDPEFGHPHHTLLKIELQETAEVLAVGTVDAIQRKVKAVEQLIDAALQRCPDEEFIRDAESRFCDLLRDREGSRAALQKAFVANKRSPFIAVRLAQIHMSGGQVHLATQVLRECLDANPHDKIVNFKLAMLLLENSPADHADIKHCLRKSFTRGDNRYAAQFWYARLLYLEGDFAAAQELFDDLSNARVSFRAKQEIRGMVVKDGVADRYSGVVVRKESTYAVILSDADGRRVFSPLLRSAPTTWSHVSVNDRVSFSLGFNYRGPVAMDVLPERTQAKFGARRSLGRSQVTV